MGRREMAVGEVGTVSARKQPNGLWRATVAFKDQSGKKRQTNAFRKTKTEAVEAVQAQAEEAANELHSGSVIEATTTVRELGQIWLADIRLDTERRRGQTIDQYAWHVEKIICGPNGIADLKIKDCEVKRLEAFLKRVAKDTPANARIARVALLGMFRMATVHGAISANPVRETSAVRKPKPRKHILDEKDREALRAQIRDWSAGKAIPGVEAARRGGPGRAVDLIDYFDVQLALGCRTGELLALRWQDLDFTVTPAEATITGTVITRPKADGGIMWQPTTKTDSGHRTVKLPPWATAILLRRQLEARAGSVFVFESSTGGLRSPHNLRRQLREARGSNFDWFNPYVLRKTNVTTVQRKHGDEAAARQAGHNDSGQTARKHYVAAANEVPDYTDALDALAPQEA